MGVEEAGRLGFGIWAGGWGLFNKIRAGMVHDPDNNQPVLEVKLDPNGGG